MALRRVILTVLAGALAAGCVTSHRVSAEGDRVARASEMNRLGARHAARVELLDGRRASVRGVQFEGDSVSWIDEGQLETVAVTEVASVRFLDRARGLRNGALVGFGTGLVLGSFVGVTSPADGWFLPDNPAPRAMVGSVFLSALTVPLGIGLGVADGHQTVYHFRPAAP